MSSKIPSECKHLVSGYCRDIEKMLLSDHAKDENNAFCHIPSQIVQLCIEFYYYTDRFIECGNKSIVLLDGGKTITNLESVWDTAYAEFEIDCDDEQNQNMIFQWTLFIHHEAQRCISIGIDESKRLWINDYPDRMTGTVSYRLNSNSGGVPYRKGKDVPRKERNINGGPPYTNDTVELELNIKERTLTYSKVKVDNGEKMQIYQFQNVETKNLKYCLSIYMWYQGKITIKDFKMQNVEYLFE